jgi:hypothetical protein
MQAHLNLCLNVLSAYERSSGAQSLDNAPFLYLFERLELGLHTRLHTLWHIHMQHMPVGDDQRTLGDIPQFPYVARPAIDLQGFNVLLRY